MYREFYNNTANYLSNNIITAAEYPIKLTAYLQ